MVGFGGLKERRGRGSMMDWKTWFEMQKVSKSQNRYDVVQVIGKK